MEEAQKNFTDTVSVTVSGKLFIFEKVNLISYPNSKLCRMMIENGNSTKPLVFYRSSACFEAIASMYQTGELHMPTNVCPKAFQRELDFWELPLDALQPCCLNICQKFEDEQSKMMEFRDFMAPSTSHVLQEDSIRNRIWLILDNRTSSAAAKV